jgi:hypothetical protein
MFFCSLLRHQDDCQNRGTMAIAILACFLGGFLLLLLGMMGRDWIKGSHASKEDIAINGIPIRMKSGAVYVHRPAPTFVRRFAPPAFRLSLLLLASVVILFFVALRHNLGAFSVFLPFLVIVVVYLLIVFRRRSSAK